MTTQSLAPPATAPAARKRGGLRSSEGRPAWLFVLPFIVVYLLFIIGPTIFGMITSLFSASLVKTGLGSWVGLANYREELQSSLFWSTLWHTIWFTLLTTVPLVVLSFVFALLANRARRGRALYRLAFFLPYILPSATIALIWGFIYTPALGILDSISTNWFGATPPSWLGDPSWAMPSIAIATIWWTIGFNFVLYLAGLQDIPRELYEAAAIDGASPLQQIRSITIPLLARTTTLVVVLQIIASLKVFDQIYLLTAGGPGQKTQPILGYIYNTAFTDYRVGAGAAASVLFFIVILIVSAVWLTITRRQERTV